MAVRKIARGRVFRGTVDTILDLPWYHPTLTEVILDVARDARAQLGG